MLELQTGSTRSQSGELALNEAMDLSQGTLREELHGGLLAVTLNTQTFTNYQLNAQLLYSSTICMLHYDHQHTSSITLLILRRTNCTTTASGIVTLCKQLYSMQVELLGY